MEHYISELSKCFIYNSEFSPKLYKVCGIIIPIFHMGKLRHSEVEPVMTNKKECVQFNVHAESNRINFCGIFLRAYF